uniref:Si:dkey-261h17.1 n=1 Tax=Cyprinus carpio TaxID=7962 RepID=A0A8C2A0L2_CYPCA
MALRRMNELWKTMALALMSGFLLLHSCWGQDQTNQTISGANETTVPSTQSPSTGSKAGPTIQPTSVTAVQGKNVPSQPSSLNISGTKSQSVNTSEPNLTPSLLGGQATNDSNLNQENEKNSSRSPVVFMSVLVTGLLLAAIIIGIYYFKFHRQTNGKGMKLAEDSYMSHEENQGSTLVSVAPLNQPEPQEKPSLNGESQEVVKAQTSPAATNGHSTTKTADTEL